VTGATLNGKAAPHAAATLYTASTDHFVLPASNAS
jgi:hypothetical protein